MISIIMIIVIIMIISIVIIIIIWFLLLLILLYGTITRCYIFVERMGFRRGFMGISMASRHSPV